LLEGPTSPLPAELNGSVADSFEGRGHDRGKGADHPPPAVRKHRNPPQRRRPPRSAARGNQPWRRHPGRQSLVE